jgi:hypothetical protein
MPKHSRQLHLELLIADLKSPVMSTLVFAMLHVQVTPEKPQQELQVGQAVSPVLNMAMPVACRLPRSWPCCTCECGTLQLPRDSKQRPLQHHLPAWLQPCAKQQPDRQVQPGQLGHTRWHMHGAW